MSDTRSDPTYWFERTDAESRRLIRQSEWYDPSTRRFFMEAGIGPGMSVLDIGSGAGDVAMLAAELVGPSGRVLGLDLNPAGLAVARERAAAAGLTNVEFIEADARAVPPGQTFDAAVGRIVLMYMADPAGTVRAVARAVNPGGVVAFQDFTLNLRWPPGATVWEQFVAWVRAAGQRAGVEMEMGEKLRRTFLDAGLNEPRLALEARVGGGAEWDGSEEAALVLRSMMPLILKLGVASAEDLDIETVEERLRADATTGLFKMPDLVSAWTRR